MFTPDTKRALCSMADYLAQDADTVEGGLSNAALAEMALERVEAPHASIITALIEKHGYTKVHREATRVVAQ